MDLGPLREPQTSRTFTMKGKTMKRLILTLLLPLATVVQVHAMDHQQESNSSRKVSLKDCIRPRTFLYQLFEVVVNDLRKKPGPDENNMDIGDLMICLGNLYKHKEPLCIALIKVINLEKLPITLQTGRETVLGEFFDEYELSRCIQDFLKRCFEGNLRKRDVAKTLKQLQQSLKQDAIKDEFGEQEWDNLNKSFKRLITAYSEIQKSSKEALDLEKLPPFVGAIVKEYFFTDKLTAALNSALKGEILTESMLLDCIDIDMIALRSECETMPNSDGIREAIEILLAIKADDKETLFPILEALGKHRLNKKAQIAVEPQPNGNSASRLKAEKEAQEQADAALARRLAEEWNGQ